MDAYITHFLIGAIPAALVFSCFYPYRCRALKAQGLRSGLWREAALVVFVMCIFGLAAMVLWPGYHWEESDGLWGNLVIHNARQSVQDHLNLIPFRMIRDYLGAFQTGDLFYAIVFLFGNLGTFLPLGFFPALLFRNRKAKHILFIGGGFSLTAEILQFFLGRHCDVDDVILNVLGAFCGYWLFLLLRRLFPCYLKRFQCSEMK